MRTSKQKLSSTIIFNPSLALLSLFLLTTNIYLTNATKSKDEGVQFIENANDESIFDITVKSGEQECNATLLTAFGVTGDKRPKDAKATTREKDFCRRNKRSCCSVFNIQSTNMSFAKGAKALRSKFEVIEELLSLFRGPLFLDYVMEHQGKSECHSHVSGMEIDLGGKQYGFFDLVYQRYQLMMIENLLMDSVVYVKKNLWFYGDLICTACNPDLQKHFIMDKNGSKFEVHSNTCSEMLEEREFERNLLLLYKNYIQKTMKFIDCVEDIKMKEEDPEAEEDEEDEVAFVKIDQAEISKFLDTFDKCWDDQRVEQEECVDFCTKSLRLYRFPIKHLMHNYKVSLQIMYKAMTTNDISDYYENIKDYEWKIDHENDPIAFFPQNETWSEYHFDTLTWQYHTSKGQNIYKELMSRKYLDFESVVIKGIAAFTALVTLFLVK